MPKTLGIWEWGCPKRGDAQNAVTPVMVVKANKFFFFLSLFFKTEVDLFEKLLEKNKGIA